MQELLRAQEEDGCLGFAAVPAPGAGARQSVDPAALVQGGDRCRLHSPSAGCPEDDVGGEEALKAPDEGRDIPCGISEPHSRALPPHSASAVVALRV